MREATASDPGVSGGTGRTSVGTESCQGAPGGGLSGVPRGVRGYRGALGGTAWCQGYRGASGGAAWCQRVPRGVRGRRVVSEGTEGRQGVPRGVRGYRG